jgi:hypothetical protein
MSLRIRGSGFCCRHPHGSGAWSLAVSGQCTPRFPRRRPGVRSSICDLLHSVVEGGGAWKWTIVPATAPYLTAGRYLSQSRMHDPPFSMSHSAFGIRLGLATHREKPLSFRPRRGNLWAIPDAGECASALVYKSGRVLMFVHAEPQRQLSAVHPARSIDHGWLTEVNKDSISPKHPSAVANAAELRSSWLRVPP